MAKSQNFFLIYRLNVFASGLVTMCISTCYVKFQRKYWAKLGNRKSFLQNGLSSFWKSDFTVAHVRFLEVFRHRLTLSAGVYRDDYSDYEGGGVQIFRSHLIFQPLAVHTYLYDRVFRSCPPIPSHWWRPEEPIRSAKIFGSDSSILSPVILNCKIIKLAFRIPLSRRCCKYTYQSYQP